MTRALLSAAVHAYGIAAIAYLAFLVRQWRPLAWTGRATAGAGLLLHAAALLPLLGARQGMPVGIAEGFAALAFLLMALSLGLDLRYRAPVLGSFLVPFALALLVPAILLSGAVSAMAPESQARLLPLHISLALAGLAAFAGAATVAAAYLLMERQVKGKRFGLLFSRLPSLQLLDELNRRLVVGGFIALSFTLVTGAFFVSQAGGLFWRWEPKEVATLVGWAVFAAVLSARSLAGWRGRRAALLTMAGFGILIVSFFSAFGALPVEGGLQ